MPNINHIIHVLAFVGLFPTNAVAQSQSADGNKPQHEQPTPTDTPSTLHIRVVDLTDDALRIYDGWEESPFRTGQLAGNIAIVSDPLQTTPHKVLGMQRSRYGSNTFGVRIDLKNPFELSPTTQYVSTRIMKPMTGRVMLIGLGKRRERAGQSPEAEQFWVFSESKIAESKAHKGGDAQSTIEGSKSTIGDNQSDKGVNGISPLGVGAWSEAVFPIKGASGIDIYSLVIVPDCEDRSQLDTDFACYIDDITLSSTRPQPRQQEAASSGNVQGGIRRISASQRNGDVTTADGNVLSGQNIDELIANGKPLIIRMKPERGFTFSGLRLRHGRNLEGEPVVDGIRQYTDTIFQKSDFNGDTLTIPASLIDGDILVEGYFVELK